MNVLAFDTCWKACSAAIVQYDGDTAKDLAHRFEEMATGQAEALPVMLADVFSQAHLTASDIDRIAVAHGPGSFTGVRIGIAAARALKLSTEADLVTCSSLHVLALGLQHAPQAVQHADSNAGVEAGRTAGHEITIAMDARREEVYVQVFHVCANDMSVTTQTEPQLLPLSQAAHLGTGDQMVVAGTGADALAEAAQALGRDATILAHTGVGDALDLAHQARRLVPLSEPLMPVYLRPPDAKPSTKPTIQRTSQ